MIYNFTRKLKTLLYATLFATLAHSSFAAPRVKTHLAVIQFTSTPLATSDFQTSGYSVSHVEVKQERDKLTATKARSHFKRVPHAKSLAAREADLLTTTTINTLVNSGRYSVLDRADVSAIVKEQRLSSSDLSDPQQAIKLGKLLSANYLVLGNLNYLTIKAVTETVPYTTDKEKKMVGQLSANIRVIDTKTGRISAAFPITVNLSKVSSYMNSNPLAMSKTIFIHDLVKKAASAIQQQLDANASLSQPQPATTAVVKTTPVGHK